jgi:hypothetical protein
MFSVNYTYRHCSKDDFSNEVSFDETVFAEKLGELNELDAQIDRIEVIFELEKGQANDKFTTTVNVISPTLGHTHSEKGDDVAKVARTAIDKTVTDIQSKNNRLHDHH